mmetsp:Transcript_43148/g.122274  ORF Transcript_43148/g.122274 Transcript_43148/m.122274 type:complete len:94 (-) Transcript_43148:282-563(-)
MLAITLATLTPLPCPIHDRIFEIESPQQTAESTNRHRVAVGGRLRPISHMRLGRVHIDDAILHPQVRSDGLPCLVAAQNHPTSSIIQIARSLR